MMPETVAVMLALAASEPGVSVQFARVVWLDAEPGRSGYGTGWHAQARAPPSIS